MVRLTKFHELNVSFRLMNYRYSTTNVWYTEVHPSLLPLPVYSVTFDLGRRWCKTASAHQ